MTRVAVGRLAPFRLQFRVPDARPAGHPKRLPTTLNAEEVPLLLAELDGQDQDVIATALYTAMRKGEVGGLLKTDLDLADGVIKLQRCWDGPATKDGKPLLVPIAPNLRPYLEAALKASGSQFLFPAAGGGMQRPDVKWDVKLRRALARAGIVVGFEHRCRRKGCGFKERRATSEASRCPRCEFRLYAKPIPRHVRFHDLRHTTATLLLKEGVKLAVVSKLLRHSDPAITLGTYGHLDVEDLRQAVDRLPFGAANAPVSNRDEPDSIPRFGAPVARNSRSAKNEGRDASEIPNNVAVFRESGRLDSNQRPLAPQAHCHTGRQAMCRCSSPVWLRVALISTSLIWMIGWTLV
jgi:integrase